MQSEVNSLANSEEDELEEQMEIPMVNSDYSGKTSDEECTSACEVPCMNERHQETMILFDIVNKAFEENDFASKSEEGVLKSKYTYVENEMHGEKLTYYKSGLIKEKGNFTKDKKDGFWCQYDTIGVEIECVEYQKGIKK